MVQSPHENKMASTRSALNSSPAGLQNKSMETDILPAALPPPLPPAPAALGLDLKRFMTLILAYNHMEAASDLHFQSDNSVRFRKGGLLELARNFKDFTDGEGKLLAPYTYKDVETMLLKRKVSKSGDVTPAMNRERFELHERSSIVHRLDSPKGPGFQIRVQPLNTLNSDKLMVRVQRVVPPSLSSLLKNETVSQDLLTDCHGLIAICGPIGSGKTTTAASVVLHWAQRKRHIATVEDPVEYMLKPSQGEVSHFSADLLGQHRRPVDTLANLVPDLLRGDVQGLFIGEVRNEVSLQVCLDLAATRAPVVTTLHSGGLADAIMRLGRGTDRGSDSASRRYQLAQCLHAIVYVDLARKAGDPAAPPIPVIVVLPAQVPAVRSAIAEGNPKTMETALAQALQSLERNRGGISAQVAFDAAVNAGADSTSALLALPEELRTSVNQK